MAKKKDKNTSTTLPQQQQKNKNPPTFQQLQHHFLQEIWLAAPFPTSRNCNEFSVWFKVLNVFLNNSEISSQIYYGFENCFRYFF